MACKFLQIGPDQNLLPTRFEIVEFKKNIYMLKTKDAHVGLLGTLKKWLESNFSMGESLLIGGYQKLMQWSVSKKKVTKDYGDIMSDYIRTMVQTSDKNYLLLSDDKGC